MITYKVKYRHYIVSLYVPEKRSGRVVLLLPGLPASSNVDKLLNALLETGSVVYLPNFSGSSDSGGAFGAKNSINDVSELYKLATKTKITELYFGKEIEIGEVKEIILIGMSFGAVVALLGHKNKFDKMILLSSALLFKASDFPTKELGRNFSDQMKRLLSLLKNAFPFSYRIRKSSDLKDFLLGKSLLSQKKSVIDAFKNVEFPTLVVHGKNDASVHVTVTESIEKELSNPKISWKYTDSGHSTSSYSKDALKVVTDFILN